MDRNYTEAIDRQRRTSKTINPSIATMSSLSYKIAKELLASQSQKNYWLQHGKDRNS